MVLRDGEQCRHLTSLRQAQPDLRGRHAETVIIVDVINIQPGLPVTPARPPCLAIVYAGMFSHRNVGLPIQIDTTRRNTNGRRTMNKPANTAVEISSRSRRTAQRIVSAIPIGNIKSNATSD